MTEQWLDNAEDAVLFSNQGGSNEAEKLLEIGNVNRTIVDENQAYSMIVLRMAARYFRRINPPVLSSEIGKSSEFISEPYKFIDDSCDITESYQQTMVGETNSRIQFMKVAIETAQGLLRNARNTIGHLFRE